MSNFIIAVVRTLVPVVVGWLVAQLARIGLDLPPDVAPALVDSLTLLVASLYYVGVAWLERKWSWFGWLLGIARNPVYAPKHSASGN